MRILISDSAKSVYHGMVGEIIKSLNSGHYVTVLVPDRFTMSVERGLLESLGKDASFLLEVQSFNYLARNELKQSARYLTPQGSVMLMSDVIDKNKDSLVYYKKAAGKNGFAQEFSDAINVIRRSGIDHKLLSESVDKMGGGPTTQKAKDLAVVYEKYLDALGKTYSDASTRLEAFAGWLREQEKQPNHDYFIMDYYDLSATEINIINALDFISPNVCLGLTSGLDNPNKDIYSADKIIERIKEINSNVKVVPKEDKKLSPQQEILSKYLFSYKLPKEKVENNGKYNLYKAKSVYEELLRVAIDIKYKVMTKNARYLDFEVVCAQPNIYYPQLKAIFNRLNIPFFIDQKEPLMAQTQIRFLLSMLEVVKSGYKREEVLSFVKNPLFVTYLRYKENELKLESNSDDDTYEDEMTEKMTVVDETKYVDYVSRFENYVLKYSINYSIFKSPFDITHKEDKYLNDEDYKIAEYVRGVMYDFISIFEQEDLTTAASLADAVKAKSLAIKDLWNYHKLVIAKIKDMDQYYTKVAEQVNKKIDLILDEIKNILGNTQKNVEGFIDMFRTMIENMNIGLVPTYRDCVYIGDLQSRFMGLGKIYIVGAAQGAFPSIHKSGIIISDSDEENFLLAGLILTPTLKDRNYTERLAALEILKKSRQETDISYSESTPNGASQPSFVLLQMESMLTESGLPIETKMIELDDLASLSEEERNKIEKVLFSTEKSKYYSTLRNLSNGRVSKESEVIYGSAYKTLSNDEKEKIQSIYRYPSRVDGKQLLGVEDDASTSISKVETFFRCPYRYYMQYGINLRERDTAKMRSTETGTVIHKVLQLFFIYVKNGEVNELNIESMVQKAFDGALDDNPRCKKMAEGEKKRVFANLFKECLEICAALYHNSCKSLFKPKMLEQSFGIPTEDGKTLQGIEMQIDPDTRVIFKGQIDRVDEYNDNVYIIDYKSYKTADINLTKLYFGEQIQLFMYMRALQHLKYKPVGVFYQPIYATYDSDKEVNRYKFKGVVHNTPGIQEAIDPDYELDKFKSFAAYDTNYGKEDENVIMDPSDMNLLGRYSEDVARSGITEIVEGFIEPQPQNGACRKCPYGDICSYAQENERNTPTIGIDTFRKIYSDEE